MVWFDPVGYHAGERRIDMQRNRVIDEAWMAEQDRIAIERWKKNQGSNEPGVSSDRIHAFLVELLRRFEEAGWPDPTIAEELRKKLRSGEPLLPV
jgi:hypothetical protein